MRAKIINKLRLISINQFYVHILMFVKADRAHVVRLTELASFVRNMARSCSTLLVAPMGVQKGCQEKMVIKFI